MVTTIAPLKGVPNSTALPQYASTFDVVAASSGSGFTVNFSSGYQTALEQMISVSNNSSASQVVHGVGYGFLNGSLAADAAVGRTVQEAILKAGSATKALLAAVNVGDTKLEAAILASVGSDST